MPEGPSIVLLKEAVKKFSGKKILSVSGDTKIGKERLLNQKVLEFRSWGKHFLIMFKGFTVRIHFLMFGSYTINERKINEDGKERSIRLNLTFKNGEINFYSSAIKIIEGDVDETYDWTADVMNDDWNPKAARKKLKDEDTQLICDTLLNQNIFAGVGNIIKNEVLYRVRVHPESKTGKITSRKITEIIKEARNYSFQFLEWKRKFELKKHWLAHTKKMCLRCNLPIIKKYTGKNKRRSFFCNNCQILYK
jgi:endonuclease-8